MEQYPCTISKSSGQRCSKSISEFGRCCCSLGDGQSLMTLFRHFRDQGLLNSHLSLMMNWVDYIYQPDEERGGKRLWILGFQLGDWLQIWEYLNSIWGNRFSTDCDNLLLPQQRSQQKQFSNYVMIQQLSIQNQLLKLYRIVDYLLYW